MTTKRFVTFLVAAALTVSSASFSCAEDVTPKAEPDGGAIAAAVVSDLVWVPGKVAVCASSGVLWTVGMVLTAGTWYKECGDLVHSACTGKWVLTGEDMMGSPDKI